MSEPKCPKCQGTGKYHNSPLSHREKSCLFCLTCEACDGKGVIGGSKRDSASIFTVDASNQICKTCNGSGKEHTSPMQHNGPQCIFCTECTGCRGAGFVQEVTETVAGSPAYRSVYGSRGCQVCKGSGLVHNSLMTHRSPCPYCEPCPNCRGTASRDPPSASDPLISKPENESECCKCTLL